MYRKLVICAAALLSAAAAPAFADNHRGRGGNDRHDNRGGNNNRGGDRHDNRGGNWNQSNNWNRGNDNRGWNNRGWDNHRNHSSLSLGILLGAPLFGGYRDSYYGGGYRYAEPVYSNSWGLYPGSCRWDREFAYWRGRPADVEVQRCADGYGSVYIVAGAQRLWRYR